MNVEKKILCINNNEYIFLLLITCLKFLLDYHQLFFSIIYKKNIYIDKEWKNTLIIRVMKRKLLTKTRQILPLHILYFETLC